MYRVSLTENGQFGAVENLGKGINTTEKEQFPYIDDHGNLFFASDGHFGMGFLDVFAARSKGTDFERPLNLGSPVNSPSDDFGISYYSDNKGYFSSNREGFQDDIYEFKQNAPPFSMNVSVPIVVKDKQTGELLSEVKVDIVNEENRIVYDTIYKGVSRGTAYLPVGKYLINLSSENHIPDLLPLEVIIGQDKYEYELEPADSVDDLLGNRTADSKAVMAAMLADGVDPKIYAKDGKLYFDVPPIFFRFNKWELRKKLKKPVAHSIKLEKYPSLKVLVNSHTDMRGSADYNMNLSRKRAMSAVDYLMLSKKWKSHN